MRVEVLESNYANAIIGASSSAFVYGRDVRCYPYRPSNELFLKFDSVAISQAPSYVEFRLGGVPVKTFPEETVTVTAPNQASGYMREGDYLFSFDIGPVLGTDSISGNLRRAFAPLTVSLSSDDVEEEESEEEEEIEDPEDDVEVFAAQSGSGAATEPNPGQSNYKA